MNSSTRGRVTLAAYSVITALALVIVADLHAQTTPLSKLGTFYSAKDPDLPPLPFNPHPELSLVEVEKGVYVVDDTGIPDTPEQAEARILREEAAARAAAVAADPVLAQAARAAQQAAQQASFAVIIEEVSPWLHAPIKMPDGTPAPHFKT